MLSTLTFGEQEGRTTLTIRWVPAEAPRGVRANAVSPPWVSETLVALKMDPSQGLPAATVARAYVAAVTGRANGETLDPAAFA